MAIVDPARLPKHIGIIMDGNGRWAKKRKLQRTAGHKEGLTSAKAVIGRAAELGIKYVTLYTFSTENWRRSQEEVHFLFSLINVYLRKEMDFYREKGIRVIYTGDTGNLPEQVHRELESVRKDTSDFSGLTVNIAINYGGRDQILRAVRRLLETGEKAVDEKSFHTFFDNPELPDADLIIRTAGEKRLSNFLLWESAYAELYFSDKLWPDWRGDDLDEAIEDYQGRTRRYGGAE